MPCCRVRRAISCLVRVSVFFFFFWMLETRPPDWGRLERSFKRTINDGGGVSRSARMLACELAVCMYVSPRTTVGSSLFLLSQSLFQ